MCASRHFNVWHFVRRPQPIFLILIGSWCGVGGGTGMSLTGRAFFGSWIPPAYGRLI